MMNPFREVRMNSLLPSFRRALGGAALFSAAFVVGCGPALGVNRSSNPFDAARAVETDVRLTVHNNDFRDAVVYAVWSSTPVATGASGRRRVGMVTGKTSQTFTFQWQASVVRIQADFIAGGSFSADPIDVNQGDHLDLVIMNQG